MRFSWGVALGLGLSLSPALAGAQTTADNLEKYKALRTRLLTEFTVVGTGPGMSQPAPERNDVESWMKWGDSTIFLGFYMGVLASQHYLITHPSEFPGAAAAESEQAIKTELYNALFALERLDEVADASFAPPCTQTPSVNGFFIRDDVPATFHQNFPPIALTMSDFIDPEPTNKEMSQDQVYHVLHGLALVKKLVPKGTTENGKDLNAWAVSQARLIGEHISKRDDWVIMNPACNVEVNRGPLAGGFSGGTRQALGFITDGAFIPDTAESLLQAWDGYKDPNHVIYLLDVDSQHMALAVAATSNGWGDETAESIAAIADKQDWPFYPLLHRVLYGDAATGWCKTAAKVNERAKVQLDELPKGGEPASPRPGGPAVHGFTAHNRYIRGKDHAYVGHEGSDNRRYSGLDYLLLHNLYAIATPATWEGGNGAGIPKCATPGPDGGTGGSSNTDGGSAGSKGDESEDSGCGCRAVSRTSPGGALWLAALFIAAAIRRGKHSRRGP